METTLRATGRDAAPVYVNKHSQYGEEVHIQHVFDVLGVEKGHLLDIGAGDGYRLSNSRALLDRGWSGDLYDGAPWGASAVKQIWVDKDFAKNYPIECDFLTIDIDGLDYWVLEGILAAGAGPLLITCEINPIWPINEKKVIEYDPAHRWGNSTYYGMSYAAAVELGSWYGYVPMMLNAGINLFLLRNDVAQKHPELIQTINYKVKFDHRHTNRGRWITL